MTDCTDKLHRWRRTTTGDDQGTPAEQLQGV